MHTLLVEQLRNYLEAFAGGKPIESWDASDRVRVWGSVFLVAVVGASCIYTNCHKVIHRLIGPLSDIIFRRDGASRKEKIGGYDDESDRTLVIAEASNVMRGIRAGIIPESLRPMAQAVLDNPEPFESEYTQTLRKAVSALGAKAKELLISPGETGGQYLVRVDMLFTESSKEN